MFQKFIARYLIKITFVSFQIVNSQIVYHSKLGNSVPINMPIETNVILPDGQWHSLRLQITQRILRIFIDDEKVGEELDAESVHNFLDPYLTTITLGGFKKDRTPFTDLTTQCKWNFTIKFSMC